MDSADNRSTILLRALERIQTHKSVLSHSKPDSQQTDDDQALCSVCFVHVQHAVVLVRLRFSDKKSDQLHDNNNLHRNFSERGDFGAHFHTYLCR